MSAMPRLLVGLFLGALALGQPAVATAQLSEARRLYNQSSYEDAIKAAAAVGPHKLPIAALVAHPH